MAYFGSCFGSVFALVFKIVWGGVWWALLKAKINQNNNNLIKQIMITIIIMIKKLNTMLLKINHLLVMMYMHTLMKHLQDKILVQFRVYLLLDPNHQKILPN